METYSDFAPSRRRGHNRAMATPFLKWAGGKAKLVPEIAARLPSGFERYHEPFLGGGAVFFGLAAERPLHRPALNDANRDLVEVFTAVRDDVDALVEAVRRLACAYLKVPADQRATFYYDVRASAPTDAIERSARLLFLNRTCYNGLFRVNRAGRFNVPHGRYANPAILNEANLRDASGTLQCAGLHSLDFEEACSRAARGDFVYLDPPYHPLSRTSHFTAYTSTDFGWADQERLARVFRELTSRGVYALLSNSSHGAIRDLYEGFELAEVPMSRAINSHPGRRSAIAELLVSNIDMVRG